MLFVWNPSHITARTPTGPLITVPSHNPTPGAIATLRRLKSHHAVQCYWQGTLVTTPGLPGAFGAETAELWLDAWATSSCKGEPTATEVQPKGLGVLCEVYWGGSWRHAFWGVRQLSVREGRM